MTRSIQIASLSNRDTVANKKNNPVFSTVKNSDIPVSAISGDAFHFGNMSVYSGATPVLQKKLRVNVAGDKYEREAESIADKVISRTDAPAIQKKCAKCDEEEQLQRKPMSSGIPSAMKLSGESGMPSVSPSLSDKINSSKGGGNKMEGQTSSFMSSRFGQDFKQVKIHTNQESTQMNRELNSRAFTVGNDIYFNSGEYQPTSSVGMNLLAHELVHTLQQGGKDSTNLQCACLPAADCSTPNTTLDDFVENTEKKPENISKAAKRASACGKTPPDASCTSDGHGAVATGLTSLLSTNFKSRLSYVAGIYVNKDIPADYGAVTQPCSSFVPPKAGGQCTFVPDRLETQAKQYNAGAKKIGSRSRESWLTSTLGTLTHETEHGRFDSAPEIAKPTPTACEYKDHEGNLSEMAAHLSEMHVYYRAALAHTGPDRFKRFYNMFNFWIKNGSEDISGIVKDLRCKCECADADYYITKTALSVSTTEKWDSNELSMIHTELRDPKWGLKWPVAPPSSVNVTDLPTTAAAPFKLE